MNSNNTPRPLEENEQLARFLFSESEYNSTKPKARAFLPSPHNNQTSVFRIHELSEVEIWEIGNVIGRDRDSSLKGRTDLTVASVISVGSLKVTPEISKHILHANIEGWPSDKAERLSYALTLATHAQLILCH